MGILQKNKSPHSSRRGHAAPGAIIPEDGSGIKGFCFPTADCQYDESGCTTCGNNQCEHAAGEDYASCPADCNWQAIDAGTNHTCGVRRDGSLWCWGRNDRGQLDLGVAGDQTVPEVVSSATGLVYATGLTTGSSHTAAWQTSGAGWAWGNGDDGQVGDAANLDRNAPVQIVGY